MNCAVTGITRGIGFELCRQLLERGETVIGLSRHSTAPQLKELTTKFGSKFRVVQGDVTSDKDVAEFASLAGATDLLINNAGVLLDSEFDFLELPMKVVEDTFAVNVLGAMRVTQKFLPLLLKSKNPFVLNITSQMGSIADNGSGGYYAYRMSKSAMNMFNKSFSIDYPQITSVVAHPGWVQTDMGGSGATTPANASVQGLLKLVYERKAGMTGHFYNFKGNELPW